MEQARARIRPSTVIGQVLMDHIDSGKNWYVGLHDMDPEERLQVVEHLEALGGKRRDNLENALQISVDFGPYDSVATWPAKDSG